MVMGDFIEKTLIPCPQCEGKIHLFGEMLTLGGWVGDEFILSHGKVVWGRCKVCNWRVREFVWT